MNYTRDQIVAAVIAEGRRRGITPRGIVIGIATMLVETNIVVYANPKVPESIDLPHDAVGFDGFSVGAFQQQVRRGANGQWWWADARTCMDPTSSAGLFFARLAKLPYELADRTPGGWAQAVQASAFPNRYDERMAEAQTIYDAATRGTTPEATVPDYGITDTLFGFNPTTPANATGNSNGPRVRTDYIAIHTQEGGTGDAIGLARFCNANQVSYNLAVDDERTVLNVPVTEAPWAAMEANDIAVHICLAGSYASWSPDRWLSTDTADGLNESAMLDRAAQAAAAACQQFGIPAVYAGDGGRSGWPIRPKGIVGHRDFGRRGGGHSDPGDGFPMDEFIRRVNARLNPTDQGGLLMALSDAEQRELLDKTRAIHAAMCGQRPSLIAPADGTAPPNFDVPTFQQCIDAATYRTERLAEKLADKLGVQR
ncbi:N-acetylmuramoyl-L-alanine amidase [Rhodococcus sp. D2-41]|uniref:peptidoglycan recognition protein family protein n=1 Tax=Speluncibacter jeojiensis TaxID=2710754 RepID=UPI00240EECEC|nr:N-acetylmuramoyl-L-alanine amidase [Rhodococcus sp. D2-41]MDG3012138.1 N-acetylmuramoyl-L-alanine amidase [Rhodococcus sp. D2-41]